MCFSDLPLELKQLVFRYVQYNDQAYRESCGGYLPAHADYSAEAGWNAWLGRGALALASVDEEHRDLFFPHVVNPLDIGRLDVNELEECLSSRVGASCHAITFGAPIGELSFTLRQSLGLETEGDLGDDAEEYYAVELAIEQLALLGSVQTVTFDRYIGDSLVRVLGSGDPPKPDYEDEPEFGSDEYESDAGGTRDPLQKARWRREDAKYRNERDARDYIPEHLAAGGSPDFRQLAAGVSSWTIPDSFPETLVAGIISVSPKLRHLVLQPAACFGHETRISAACSDFASALTHCDQLESLELASASGGTSYGRGGVEIQPHVSPVFLKHIAAHPPPVKRLTLHLHGFDASLATFINTLPSLQRLVLLDSPENPSSARPSAAVAAANTSPLPYGLAQPSTLSIHTPSLTSLVTLLSLLSLPHLDRLTLTLDKPPSDNDTLLSSATPTTSTPTLHTLATTLLTATPSLTHLALSSLPPSSSSTPRLSSPSRSPSADSASSSSSSSSWSSDARPIRRIWPAAAVAGLVNALAVHAPRVQLGVDWGGRVCAAGAGGGRGGTVQGQAGGEGEGEGSVQEKDEEEDDENGEPSALQRARGLVEWLTAKLDEAERGADGGLVRMVSGSLGTAARLRLALGG
ncbi:hypothetical protein JCM8097_004702 [Rhodosporidiobolus ruineniae]